MSRFIYALSLRIYSLLLHLIAPFHPKAKQWVHGRRRLFDKLRKFKEQETRPIIWMHCASLGEFEQGRPLLESCKQQYANYAFVLSFFSPSGYEIRKNSPLVDAVFYLPLDHPQQANNWLDILQPSAAIFVKYDLWYHYLTQLKKRAIPNILISANFRPQQLFFKFYGGFFREMLYCFDHIFLQEQSATSLLDSITISNYTVAGDTRIDRVIQNKATGLSYPIVQQFAQNSPLLVGGSTWPKDEQLLLQFLASKPDYKLVLAPHEIDTKHLKSLMNLFKDYHPIFYSEANKASNLKESSVLIIDNIGMLNTLYAYATIAYVGGGFGKGIHNILEAVIYEIPVIFGPKYYKFKEAKDLINLQVAFSISNAKQLQQIILNTQTQQQKLDLQRKVEHYINANLGATRIILEYMQKYLAD